MKGDPLGTVEVGDELAFEIVDSGLYGPLEVVAVGPSKTGESAVVVEDGPDHVRLVGGDCPTATVIPGAAVGDAGEEAFAGLLGTVKARP